MKKLQGLKWFAAIFFIVFCGILFSIRTGGEVRVVPSEDGDVSGGELCPVESEDTETKIFVHVCGAVVCPGVYELNEGSRVIDAVDMAGGFAGDAAQDTVNLAAFLTDATRLYIPREGEETCFAEDTEAADGRVDINHAGRDELMSIPGIGGSRADAIIEYREKHGGFKDVEDIRNVSGIKDGVFQKIRDHIRVG